MATTQPAMFQCGLCKREYKRLDHLSRHVRSHTQTKPHKCHICGKSFTRTDLLKRHVAGHDARGGEVRDTPFRGFADAPGRVTQACRACASNHLRCTEDKPCRRCQDKGLDCRWDAPMDVDQVFTPPDTVTRSEAEIGGITPPYVPSILGQPGLSPAFDDESDVLGSEICQSGVLGQTLGETDPFPFELPAFNLLSAQWTPAPGLDMDMTTTNELDDMDLRFLDNYNISIPFEVGDTFEPLPQEETVSRSSSDPGQPAAMCAEAFRNSHWHFRPNARDHAGAEEHNLSLPLSPEYASPESRIRLDSRVTCAKLGVTARDQILTMVVKGCNPENLPKAVASFPSVELLDTLLQYYLTSPCTRVVSFIHAATFDPNEKRPELVAAMAACGAVLTSDSALTKLGFAIMECVKLSVSKLWESNNALIRDLQLAQAFLITLEIGLWSGQGRKVEIAESFLYPLLTMLRRDGKFRRCAYPVATLDGVLDSVQLERKWLDWVEAESFKRVVFRLLIHDTHSSMALLTGPLVPYLEVQLPIPDSVELWSAATAGHWSSIFASKANLQELIVADVVDDPELLNTNCDSMDTKTASYAVLSFAWSLIWEYTRMKGLQALRPRRWNALITTSRLDELLKLLSNLRMGMSSVMSKSPELVMRLELIHLHLHMPFEDIQIFAGMEGPEQARAVYPMIRDWVKSEAARRAIYHAGQIIRVAKMLPKAYIRGPDAIVLYHASLAFWVYGLLFEQPREAKGCSSDLATSAPAEDVLLDEMETIASQRFAELGHGKPCIRWFSSGHGPGAALRHVHLAHPDKVMDVVVGVVQVNFEGAAMPHLTSKLIQLMAELKKSSCRTVRA